MTPHNSLFAWLRFVLLGVCFLVLNIASGEPGAGQKGGELKSFDQGSPLRIAIYDVPDVSFLGFIIANTNGIYAKEGFPTVEFIWRQELETVFDLLKSGKADFAVSWMGEGIAAAAKGLDIVAISRLTQHSSETVFVRRDMNPTFGRLADLDGRKVGVAFRRDLSARAFFHRLGITPSYIIFRPESSFVLNEGVVDAVAMPRFSVDAFSRYTRFREELRILPMKEHGTSYPEDTIFCLRSFFRKHPDVCRRFVRATWQGWSETIRDTQSAANTLVSQGPRGAIPADLFYITKKLERWITHLGVDKDLEKNGGCDQKEFDQLRTDLISAKLIDSEKAPVFSSFFYDLNRSKSLEASPTGVTSGSKEK